MILRRVLATAGLSALVLSVATVSASPSQADPSARTRPAAVTDARAQWSSSTKISLAWRTHGTAATLVTMARGTQSPATPDRGITVAVVKRPRQSITVTDLAPGVRYSFALFARDTNGTYARRVSVGATTAPGPVTNLHAYAEGRNTMLQWVKPTPAHTLTRIVVRYTKGRTAPNRPWHGTNVTVARGSTTATLSHLAPDTIYSASVWALDATGRHSTILATTFTTNEKPLSDGHYAGLVTDVAGHPLRGVQVSATDFATGATRSVSTTADGRYALALPPGTQWVFDLEGQNITGGTSDATGYVPDVDFIDVVAGRTVRETVRLQPGGVITGRVADAAGRPLAGVPAFISAVSPYVEADDDNSPSFGLTGVSMQPAISRADGSYTVKGVPSLAVQICFDTTLTTITGGTSPQYAAACTSRSSLVPPAGARTAGTTVLQAAAVGSITGTVTSARGPVAGATVVITSTQDDSDGGGVTTTDSDGSFSQGGLAPGRYAVCVVNVLATPRAPSGYAPSCPTRTVTVVAGRASTVTRRLSVGAALTGRILGHSGKPLADVTVLAVTTGHDLPVGGHATTDSRGHYTVSGLVPGSYQVCFQTAQVPSTAHDPTGALPSCYSRAKVPAVADRVLAGVDSRLAAGGAVAGRVLDSKGRPLSYASVMAVSPDDQGDLDGASYALASADGRFVLANLPTGRYQICFFAYDDAGDSSGTCRAGTVAVRAGHTVYRVNATVPPPATLSVTVHDTSGHPVAGVDATAIAACEDDGDDSSCTQVPILDPKKNVDVVTGSVTDSAGRARLTDLDPGRYAVCLFAYYGASPAGSPTEGYADTCSGHTLSLVVAASRTTSLAMTVAPAGAITGTVTDLSGHPLAGVVVHVTGSAADNPGDGGGFFGALGDGPAPSDDSVTAADGTYSIRSVIPGAQRVCFDASTATGATSRSGYLDQCQGAAAGSTSGGTTVTITAGQSTADGTFALSPAASISGKITTSDGGSPDYGTQVVVLDSHVHVVGEADLDDPGSYSVSQLRAGTYYVCVLGYPYESQCWKGVAWPDSEKNPPLSKSTPLVLTAGATRTGVDLTLR